MRAALSILALVVATPAFAQAPVTLPSRAGPLRVETIAGGLQNPWGMSFLPDGRLLVSERAARLRLVTREGQVSEPIAGLPEILVRGQGGLLDVAVAPDFATSRRVVFCHAHDSGPGASTALSVGRLVEEGGAARLQDVRRIFLQEPAIARGHHFGCRIVFAPDGTVLLTLGDYFQQMREAQNLANTIGKVVRVALDGSIPPDNPFVGRSGVHPSIYSWGHRNVQGATWGPDGRLWVAEHGARGGDEINRVEPGRNYGWPTITYALDYSGAVISPNTHRDGMEQPVHHWPNTDTIAPSGAAFVSGDMFARWRGNMLVGGLRSRVLIRLVVQNGRVTEEERLLSGLEERLRDVRLGPDGAIWLLTDNPRGRVLRVTPAG